jgi:hypothetical protein
MKDYYTLINDEMRLEIDNYYNIENVDYKLKIWTSGGRYIELFLQPEIDYTGTVREITSPDSNDDSFILHERYYQDIINAMDDLKRYYEQDHYLTEKRMQEG